MAVDPASALVVGVDFGTLSGRPLAVRVVDGAELGSAVHPYTHGVVDDRLSTTGAKLPPDWALQVRSDYELFAENRMLRDYFGCGANSVMHHPRDLRRRAHGGE
jgi:ribulose kinase